MSLKEITAEEIMSKDLLVIAQDEKISTAEIKMIKKNVGGLPVVGQNNELIGIITQRDIQLSRNLLLATSTAFHVDDLMSRNPICATPVEKLPSIVKKMVDHNIERIPVVNNAHNVVGIITTKDIIHSLAKHLET